MVDVFFSMEEKQSMRVTLRVRMACVCEPAWLGDGLNEFALPVFNKCTFIPAVAN